MKPVDQNATDLQRVWTDIDRWTDICRPYKPEEVLSLRPSITIEHSLAKHGSEKLWRLLKDEAFITSLGVLNGSQAVQMVKAGLRSLYLSGWQVAADANLAGHTYPDQSLYPSNSVPNLLRRINNALMRADQVHAVEGNRERDWYVPIVADAEAGFGGPLHAFELMISMIEAGASGVHFEDQLASEKKCGHMGGKVLIPTSQFIRNLIGARLAADVLAVPTVLVARTDAHSARFLTSDVDLRDREFIVGQRSSEGYYLVQSGIASAIARGIAYAPYADVLWFETSTPDLDEAAEFAEAIHAKFPQKILAYNCSPSFHWKRYLSDKSIAKFNESLGQLGYKYQFITLAGWHSVNLHAFKFTRDFLESGMPAYVRLQEEEMALERQGYTGVRHQREVGTGYYDQVLMTVYGGAPSTGALDGSTEKDQF